jgi:AcrR family transcriptional regulator
VAAESPSETRPTMTQAERTALSDRLMIEAAVELICERGIDGTTLKDIGERAGYSRGLATYRFGSKAGLFRAVIKSVSQRWLAELTQAVAGKQGLAALLACVDSYHRLAVAAPAHIRALHHLFYQSIGPRTELRDKVADALRRQRADVALWIRQGILAGEIASDVDPTVEAEKFCALIHGVTYQWLVEPEAVDLAALSEALKRDLRRTLAA